MFARTSSHLLFRIAVFVPDTNGQPSTPFKEDWLPSCGGRGQRTIFVQPAAPYELASAAESRPAHNHALFRKSLYAVTEWSRGPKARSFWPHVKQFCWVLFIPEFPPGSTKVLMDFHCSLNSTSNPHPFPFHCRSQAPNEHLVRFQRLLPLNLISKSKTN